MSTSGIIPLKNQPGRGVRFLGSTSTAAAFVIGYLFWILSRDWWWPTLITTIVLLVSIFVLDFYLAYKYRKFVLYFAGILTLLAPAVVIVVSFGFFFSGPPS